MRPIGSAELRDQYLDALLDGVLREDHRTSDLFVGVTLSHVAKQLQLARRQRLVRRFFLGRSIRGHPTWHARRSAFARALRVRGLVALGAYRCAGLERLTLGDRCR